MVRESRLHENALVKKEKVNAMARPAQHTPLGQTYLPKGRPALGVPPNSRGYTPLTAPPSAPQDPGAEGAAWAQPLEGGGPVPRRPQGTLLRLRGGAAPQLPTLARERGEGAPQSLCQGAGARRVSRPTCLSRQGDRFQPTGEPVAEAQASMLPRLRASGSGSAPARAPQCGGPEAGRGEGSFRKRSGEANGRARTSRRSRGARRADLWEM